MLPESKVDLESHLCTTRVTYVIRGLRLNPSGRSIEIVKGKLVETLRTSSFPSKFI